MLKTNSNVVLVGEYTGARDKVAVKGAECGHEWEATATNLLKGSGCPYCAGLLPIPGKTDLATVNPGLADQWHLIRNGALTPKSVGSGSTQKVWWICKNGHEWEAPVAYRTRGDGCPYCSNRRVLAGYNDLATIAPKLAAEWHPSKNAGLTASMVTAGTSKKVWWRCEKGHEWQASVASRHSGNGCPYCSNKKILRGYNDLATVDPGLAAEWSPRNDFSPYDIMAGSPKMAWWRCANNHEWSASIQSRHLGHGCPYCAGQRAVDGVNDLATINPGIAAQWHPFKNGALRPSDVTSRSTKKVWWQCELGHEWEATVDARHAAGCPYCSGHRVLIGFNDLATVNPSLAAQWHPTKNGRLNPEDVTTGSGRKVWWQCELGHEWKAAIVDRSAGTGCPYCSNQKVLAGFNDLSSQFPDVAAQWHPTRNGTLGPNNVIPTSTKKVWWLCPDCGYEWKSAVWLRTYGWGECPACKVKMHGTSFPEQALLFYLRRDSGMVVEHRPKVDCSGGKRVEVDIWLPSLGAGIEYDGIFYHAGRQDEDDEKARLVRSSGMRLLRVIESNHFEVDGDDIYFDIERDPKSHQSEAFKVVYKMLDIEPKSPFDLMGDRIAILGQYKKEMVENSLAALAPGVAEEWDFEKNGALTPDKVSVSSNIVACWKCKNGHSWEAMVKDRTSGNGCPYCSGRLAVTGENDLQTLYPDVAAQWHPSMNGSIMPSEVKPGSGKVVWWRCELGHEWQASVYNRAMKHQRCPYCSGRKVLTGFNDLASLRPDLARQWSASNTIAPDGVTAGSLKKAWWICDFGHEWQTSIRNRVNGSGCPYCAGQKAIPGQSDLATVNPALAAQWHPMKNGVLLPSMVKPGSAKKVWWQCEKGHEWQASIRDRSQKRYGCPYCSGKRLVPGLNDLATINPDLASQWHPTKNGNLTPIDVKPKSNIAVWWLCDKGHEWKASINNRAKGAGCPYCSGRRKQ